MAAGCVSGHLQEGLRYSPCQHAVQIAAHQPFLSKKNYAYWVGRVAYWDVHERDRQRCVAHERLILCHTNWNPEASYLITCLVMFMPLLPTIR